MEHGIIVAVSVTAAWIVLQNLVMHVHPAENRFRAMAIGYLISLVAIYPVWRWMPPLVQTPLTEAPLMGLFHAYFLHLMLSLFYIECFYHIERSVTLRVLIEILKHGQDGVPLQTVQGRYSVDDMIRARMDVLRDRGFVELQGDVWRLGEKGLALARITRVICFIFRAKMQHER